MTQARPGRLEKLPRSMLPKGRAFRQGPTALILLLPSLVVVFGIVLYPLLRTL
jgi:ABC-type sugar transport system permease subunit